MNNNLIMNKNIILCAAAALLLLRRRNAVAGISPRHWLYEIGLAQQAGIDFYDDYQPADEIKLETLAKNIGVKLTPKEKAQGVKLGEKYFNQLARKFKPLKSQIGAVKKPFERVYIKNSLDENVIEVHDYDERRDASSAISYVEENLVNGRDNHGAFWATVAAIARGAKFVWNDKKKGGTVLAYGIESSLFGQGNHPKERKSYFNIIATPKKGGMYPEKFAEEISLEQNVLGGVLEALKQVNSQSTAIQLCLDAYYKQFEVPDQYKDYNTGINDNEFTIDRDKKHDDDEDTDLPF